MTDWSAGFVVVPMREWPGTMTARRRRSQFASTQSATLVCLLVSAVQPLSFLEALVNGWADRTDPARLLRGAHRLAHPDAVGDVVTFQRVSLAGAKLREEGLL